MEETEEKGVEKTNEFSITKFIQEHAKLPINLVELNLSNNRLSEVPVSVANLENLKVLDLSHNCIKYFDETPKFCHTIQSLAISHNDLRGPPHWVWSEAPASLAEINLSCNRRITQSLHSGYYEELLEYKVPVTKITVYNCKLIQHMNFISCFPNAKSLVLGSDFNCCYNLNQFDEVPCNGMDKCCDIEYLCLSNLDIYNVKSDIQMYRNLKEINLSYNKLESLPEEFCSLKNLEVCILSYNHLFGLPENFCNLSKITDLSVDCNELYILPSDICKLPNIRRLDVYNNYINTAPDGIENLLEVDLAQNYFDEPNDDEYLEKRKIVRANKEYRCEGRKEEEVPESESSRGTTDDELLFSSEEDSDREVARKVGSSSSEDWDSDEYWVPHKIHYLGRQLYSPWQYFVKKKIEQGNFCPFDAHCVPIADQIRYERMHHPKVQYESDGQFDDISSDDD